MCCTYLYRHMYNTEAKKKKRVGLGQKLHSQNAPTRVSPCRSKVCTHPQALLHTLYIYIYIYDGMATQERWERKTCLQIHVQKICAWYHEKNKKASTEAIQNAWMHGGNKKTASNHITACKLAVALHAHSRKKKKAH